MSTKSMARFIKTTLLCGIGALFLLRGSANASNFEMTGNGCMPESWVISGNLFDNTFGWFTFAAGKSGTITENCPVNFPSVSANPTTLSATFFTTGCASDGSEDKTATYYKMNKSTGALTAIATVGFIGCSFSGCTLVNGGNTWTCSATFTDTQDTSTYRYFVLVQLRQTDPGSGAKFYGATLH